MSQFPCPHACAILCSLGTYSAIPLLCAEPARFARRRVTAQWPVVQLVFCPMFRDKTKQLWSVRPLFITTCGDPEVFSRCPQRTSSRRSEAGRPGSARPLQATGGRVRKVAEDRGTTPSRPRISRSTHTTDSNPGPAVTGYDPCVMLPTIHSRSRLCSASSASLRFRPNGLPFGWTRHPSRPCGSNRQHFHRGVLCVLWAFAVRPETFADEFPAVDLLASSMDADVVVHSDYYCTVQLLYAKSKYLVTTLK